MSAPHKRLMDTHHAGPHITPETNMINVMLADGQPIFRGGLKEILSSEQGFNLIGETDCGDELCELLKRHKPDVLIIGISVPGSAGIDLIGRIHQQHPALPILVLSMLDEPLIATLAIKAGARGYLTKDMGAREMLAALHKVARGGRYIVSGLAERMLFDNVEAPYLALSSRERNVFDLLILGKASKEIANTLCISNKTVCTHKLNLLEKMKMRNTAELVKYAVQNGLLV